MAFRHTIALLLAAGAILGATGADARRNRRDDNLGLSSMNQPVVQRTDYVIDLASAGPGLSVAERARLRGWFDSLGLGYGDRVAVDMPYSSDPARADVARVAAEYGLLLSDGAPVTARAVEPGSIRVVVSRSSARVPGCPFADEHQGPSATSLNYGCATNSNLAAMIADPNDLVLGRSGAAAGDPSTAAKAIKVYREAAPSGTKGLQNINSRAGQ
jgi:pilus assembly protein CpaD